MMSSGPMAELGYGAGAMRRGLPAPSSQAAVLAWDMVMDVLLGWCIVFGRLEEWIYSARDGDRMKRGIVFWLDEWTLSGLLLYKFNLYGIRSPTSEPHHKVLTGTYLRDRSSRIESDAS